MFIIGMKGRQIVHRSNVKCGESSKLEKLHHLLCMLEDSNDLSHLKPHTYWNNITRLKIIP
jgi:hypothetical protein